MTRIIAALLLVTAALASPAQTPIAPPTLLVAIDKRPALSLNGDWHYIADPYLAGLYDFHGHPIKDGYFQDIDPNQVGNKLVEYDFRHSPTLRVPGDWNTQAPRLELYEGGLWYERHFTLPTQTGKRTFLHIGAANYRSRAYLNGHLLCEHEGGFTPFDCETTQYLKPGENDAVIFVDDTRIPEGVPTVKTDWYNYGGLTRDVSLVTVPAAFIDDFNLTLDRTTRTTLSGYVHVEGAPQGTPVTLTIPELKATLALTTDASGRAELTLPLKNLQLWSPDHPKLYEVTMTSGPPSGDPDSLTDTMGFRTVETRGSQILLNGQPIALNGVSIHAEAPYRTGRANTDADVATLLGWAKELGCNYARLAHYPHDQRMTRAADKLGILIWSEVPVYWAEHFEDQAVFLKSQQQLHEMIRRDRDKASVILWSIANETPNSPARTDFLTRSAAYVHAEDPTRLVTAALLVRAEGTTKIIDDPLAAALDVIGFNEYIGWYEGAPALADTTTWQVAPLAANKPLIVSEFGGGAKAGLHGPATQRWTEDYQAEIYKHNIAMLRRIPNLRGATPWVLMDFRSPVRQLVGIQDGFNRKGLISDQGKKKAAFFVLQQAYKTNALAHAN